MKLIWVNHASFLVVGSDFRLICDPWLEGPAFNDGWKLYAPTQFAYEDFARVTHIWISHEHPDHFHPPSLAKIPEAYRQRITVLFHETPEKRVVNRCKELGFLVRELPSWKRVPIAPGCEVICGTEGWLDSWLGIFSEGKTILNLNDCLFDRISELRAIHRTVGKVDALLTQFSCAGWVGNPADHASHVRHAQAKRIQLATQAMIFRPAHLIPSASYAFYCHHENRFMNDCGNQIGEVYELVSGQLKIPTVVLYPGDEWELGSDRDSAAAIRRYQADFQTATTAGEVTSTPASLETLQKAGQIFVSACLARNNPWLLRAMAPAVVRLRDLNCDVQLSFRKAVVPMAGNRPDIIMSSDAFLYCLSTDWGGDTLLSNCRFQIPEHGKPRRFFRLLRVPAHNSYGNRVDIPFVARQLGVKIQHNIGQAWNKFTSMLAQDPVKAPAVAKSKS